ncbi:MAG TPA: ribbon-helix-helix protein, CopG family [Candidatus Paceibacterota bacterium]|nr:ribbon-helix-helix protein, CopG family [Candidatus Paceibacterota bacterium]
MRITHIMTVSLPPALVRQFEEVRKKESRTRSELVREALRSYFESRYPMVMPTKAERAAMRRGRAALQRGDAMPLKKFLHEMESADRRSGAKRISNASRKRSGAH